MLPIASTSQTPYSQQPAPSYILRGHTAQISVLQFSSNGRWLYSGDVDGWLAVWDLNTFRPRLFWRPHTAGLLSIEEWDSGLLTHARDNLIHYTPLPTSIRALNRAAATAVPSPKEPTPLRSEWSLDVNAMAYCRMSILRLGRDEMGREKALVAVPALTRDELIDIFHIPSMARVHRSIGANCFIGEGNKTGTVMSLQLFTSTSTSSSSSSPLHLLAAYEDGRVAHFAFTGSTSKAFDPPTGPREEGEEWELVWEEKGHREAVMSLALSPDKETAWSCAADHNICQYSLFAPFAAEPSTSPTHLKQTPTEYPGRSALAVRDDGKLLAVAGWDGETRLYSTKSSHPLAVLSYHRTSLHALAFAPCAFPLPPPSSPSNLAEPSNDSDSDSDDDDEAPRWSKARPWLAVGGKDEKISLWEMYPPEKGVVAARGVA
ncbi:WD40-repeat-containing domain protein [Leucosporidium creatinivorum]|uniref:ASTRA-associated protein 1 n=1 Tax=Leucosporidium creatinivorum TaxID=106004 RepID=A0A1Y2F3W0_9BASI|nr:WD40-repeat-containing domain protein [Leucosporidium creatinivorum]